VSLTLALSQRERGLFIFKKSIALSPKGVGGLFIFKKIYCPLSLWERAGVRAATVYRFNQLIRISIRRSPYRILPDDKSIRSND